MVAIILNIDFCKRHLPTPVMRELAESKRTQITIPVGYSYDYEKPWKSSYRVSMKNFYSTVMDYIKSSVNKQLLQKKREKLQQDSSFRVSLHQCEEQLGDLAELH